MRFIYVVIALAALTFGFLERCGFPASRDQDDETLAKNACSGCHAFPEPGLLPREQWEKHVLPAMARFMGRFDSEAARDSMFEAGEAGVRVRKAGVFPSRPMLSDEEWQRISDYYLNNAPEKLSSAKDLTELPVSSLFLPEIPANRSRTPSVTLLQWSVDGLRLGEASTGNYLELRPDFSIRRAGELEQAPVSTVSDGDNQFIAVMGSFSPTDASTGMLVRLPDDEGKPPAIEIDSLQRPVHVLCHDWDDNGRKDFLICEFGKYTGSLAWYLSGESGYRKMVLRSRPGAVRAEIADLNADGLSDVVALFGQADECVEVFLNKGQGQFEVKRLLTFPPCYGSSGFQLADIDNDGDQDIIYTAGDNADFFPVVKPYHGIYIYENRGGLRFEKKEFLHLPGAYAVKAGDYNADGRQDLAAISFFPDWSAAEPVDFVLWLGEGGGSRRAERIPLSAYGRWILMDAGDADRDGDQDIFLGSLMMEPVPDNGRMKNWLNRQIPFLVLRNTTRR